MSEQLEQRREPVGRQVAALKELAGLVAERAEAEARVEGDRARRVEAAGRAFQQATRANEARLQADRAELDRRAREEPEAARATFEKTKERADAAALLVYVREHWHIENPQSDGTPSVALCAADGACYDCCGGPSGVGRMVRSTTGPWRRPMPIDEPILAPPRP